MYHISLGMHGKTDPSRLHGKKGEGDLGGLLQELEVKNQLPGVKRL